MKHLILIISILTSTLSSFAQERRWSLEECMLFATQNNFGVARADINHRNSRLGYTNNLLSHLPSLNAGVEAGSSWGSNIDPGTNLISKASVFSHNISAGVNLPIFDGLSLINATRTGRIAMLSGVQEKRQAEDKVALDCMLAYIEVVYNRSLVGMTKEKLDNSRLNLRKTKRLEELGTMNAADVAQIEAEVATDELSLITQENKLEVSILKLKDLMNYPIGSILEIQDDIPLVEIINNDQGADAIYDQAVRSLPGAIIGEYALETSRLKLQTAKWSLLPSLSAYYGLQSRYYSPINSTETVADYSKQIEGNFGQGLSVTMNIPLFNGLDRMTRMSTAKNNYAQAQNDWNENQRKIQSEIEMALMDCRSAEKQWQQAEKSARATEIAHNANMRKYDQGLLGIIELQLSSNKLLVAKAELVYSRLRFTALSRQVNYYKGVPYF